MKTARKSTPLKITSRYSPCATVSSAAERLERIECILNRAAGEPVTVRDFTRRYDVWKWELEQAADLGWIEIIVRKPRTGRSSPAVKFQEHSENPPAKLPPPRWAMEKMISCRHFNFAMQAANALKRGNRTIVYLQCMTDAYLKSFPHAENATPPPVA